MFYISFLASTLFGWRVICWVLFATCVVIAAKYYLFLASSLSSEGQKA